MGPLTGEPKQSHPVIRTATVYSARRCAHGGEAFQLTGGGLANFDVGDSAMSFGKLLQLQGQQEEGAMTVQQDDFARPSNVAFKC
jgi:hypothetical protein